VFFGWLETFSAAFDGYAWLAAVNPVASLFYYLRRIGPAFLARGPAGAFRAPAGTAAVIAYGAAAGSVVLGLIGGTVLDVLDGPLAR
jgi:NADH-quinone oxidoreductase subunit N